MEFQIQENGQSTMRDFMHTVIADECTGCDLCVEPCPVDCIDMVPRKDGIEYWRWALPDPAEKRSQIIASDRVAA